MKRWIGLLVVMITVTFVGAVAGFSQTAVQPSGSGTAGDPYLVDSLANLAWIQVAANDTAWGSYYVQTASIDASTDTGWNSEAGFTPIGNSSVNFTGTYDGNGFTISGLYFSQSGSNYVALFGSTNAATIKNLGLLNINVTGGSYVGGLAGEIYGNTSVNNCYTTGTVSGAGLVGGLVGMADNSSIVTGCHSTANVTASINYVGGLLGHNHLSTVDSSYSTGQVTGTGTSGTAIGGLVGYNFDATIMHSHSTSQVSAPGASASDVGGLVGENYYNATIKDSYSSGNVTSGGSYLGGFAGVNETSVITKSYSTSNVSGSASASNYVGGFLGQNNTGVDSNSYCTGSATGYLAVGGFVGYNYSSSVVENCYSIGKVSGAVLSGGFVGYAYNSAIDSSFWDTDSSGQSTSTYGGTGETDSQMKSGSTFTDALWDFSGTWAINSGTNNGYPYLANVTDYSLPVQATGFIATVNAGSVTISWRTQSEFDNAGFKILRHDQPAPNYEPRTRSWELIASYTTDLSLRGLGTSSTGRNYSFTDTKSTSGASYEYKIQSVSANGTTKDLSTLSVTADVPKTYALFQNYPNPFNPTTVISYELSANSMVSLKIYDMLGREVATLVDGAQNAGVYKLNFDGSRFASGVYFYRLFAQGNDGRKFESIKKLVLIK
jgi:Secretion system C-terminal sorting domain/The GLUG motif